MESRRNFTPCIVNNFEDEVEHYYDQVVEETTNPISSVLFKCRWRVNFASMLTCLNCNAVISLRSYQFFSDRHVSSLSTIKKAIRH